MVALDEHDDPVRPALLWNDTRSAGAAQQLVEEWGGPQARADLVGSVLVASFTVTKLRWLRDHEPERRRRTHRVLLPHDHLSQHLAAPGTAPFTDRGDASGTGYFSTQEDRWRPDLAASALGREVELPRVALAGTAAAETRHGQVVGPGTGDNMAAALALDLQPGDVLISVGTSGVASARAQTPVHDGSGLVTGFADATGGFLPLAVTLNAARILDLQARLWVSTTTAGRPGPVRPAGLARRHPAAVLRGRADPEPAARRRHLVGADHRHRPGRAWPGPPSRRWPAAWPTRSTPWPRSWTARWAGSCSSGAPPAAAPCSRSSRPSWGASWSSRRRASTSPAARPGRPRGRCRAQPPRRPGPPPARAPSPPTPRPQVREAYVRLRDQTVEWDGRG